LITPAGFFFGIKYKTPAIDGATEIIDLPDLLRDPNLIPSTTNPLYTDPSGSTSAKSETMLALDRENPFYTHRETHTGIHEYANLSVNWFSRASGLVMFYQQMTQSLRGPNTLMPPLDFRYNYCRKKSGYTNISG